MYAVKQIHEDLQDVIPVPENLRHRRTEVIFIALDDPVISEADLDCEEHPLLAFAGAFGAVDEAELAKSDAEIRGRRLAAGRARE